MLYEIFLYIIGFIILLTLLTCYKILREREENEKAIRKETLKKYIISNNKDKIKKYIVDYEIDSNLFEWTVDPRCQPIGILDGRTTYNHYHPVVCNSIKHLELQSCNCGWILKKYI